MKRYILVLAAIAAFGFASCDLVSQMTGADTGGDSGGSTAPGGSSDSGSVNTQPEEVPGVIDYGSGTMVFSFSDGNAQGQTPLSSRSMIGPSSRDIVASDYLVNYNEVILVDSNSPAKIWDFNAGSGDVIVRIKKDATYKILILSGHKPTDAEKAAWGTSPTTPSNTLLSSGYREVTMSGEVHHVNVTMTPLVIGVEFLDPAAYTADQRGDRSRIIETGRLAIPVGLYQNNQYNVRFTIGSRQMGEGSADDAKQTVAGNGLYPLLRAQDGVMISGAQQQYGLKLKNNTLGKTGGNLALSDGGRDFTDNTGGRSVTVSTNVDTPVTPTYMITANSTTGTTPSCSLYLNITYAPFGMDNYINAGWNSADFTKRVPTAADVPIWTIRNGLNDLPQKPMTVTPSGNISDYGTSFEEYGVNSTANANGAISIGVVAAS
jgi:hypothetical protein